MLADVIGVVLVFGVGGLALGVLAFVQRAMTASGPDSDASPVPHPKRPEARGRIPLPFARALLLWLLLSPAFALVVAWSVAVRDLGPGAIAALAGFALPLFVAGLAFVGKRGLDP